MKDKIFILSINFVGKIISLHLMGDLFLKFSDKFIKIVKTLWKKSRTINRNISNLTPNYLKYLKNYFSFQESTWKIVQI